MTFEEKYKIDDSGNVWFPDPIGVVRSALERSGYQLDPSWYAWGTKASKELYESHLTSDNFKPVYPINPQARLMSKDVLKKINFF